MSKNSGNEDITNIIVKKRGRKSKKAIEESEKDSIKNEIISTNENILIKIEETQTNNQLDNSTSCIDEIIGSENENANINETNNESDNIKISTFDNKLVCKKRGRKPKGGKIIQQTIPLTNVREPKPNVILHLKCSLKDLNLSSNLFGSNLNGFSFFDSNKLSYDIISDENNLNDLINPPAKLSEYEVDNDNTENDFETTKNKENDIREIWKKLKILQHNLHINNISNKKSACFWDTCEFDNPPVYIPKHLMNETYHVYGCFCSPECAVAHLMEENIDSSIKFERYQLINHIYSKVYNYKKNIKPAPNPFYMMEKYYGNLTIQEYRSLLQNERLYLVVDKPLTRIMPELHEDNDDFIINNKIIPTNNIKLRKIQRKQTKTNILSERFGLNQ
jgi:hypothetical protein